MSGIGASMAGGNPASGAQQPNKFYETSEVATRALFTKFKPDGPIWECACGKGRMSEEMKRLGMKVISSDLIDYGYGIQQDFLKTKVRHARNIVTNPPFDLAVQFIEHAMELEVDTLALLLKSTYWHADNRYELFQRYKPAKILPLTWRLDFMNLGRPTMECSWFVWIKGDTSASVDLLRRPRPRLTDKP